MWNSIKNSTNKLEKISNLATKQVMGVDPQILRNTSFPIKSTYRMKPISKEDSDDNDTFSGNNTDHLYKSQSVIKNYSFRNTTFERKLYISPIVASSVEHHKDYFDLLKKHYRRRRINAKRICNLAKPRELPSLSKIKQRKKRNKFNIHVNKKLNLSYEFGTRKKERNILINSVKASKSN